MTDLSEASRTASGKDVDDAILLDVIVSPEKAEGTVGEAPETELSVSAAGELSGDTGAASFGDAADETPGPDGSGRFEPELSCDGESRSGEAAGAVAGTDSVSEKERSGRLLIGMEEGEPVFEGDAAPWTPAKPKIIDPEADADEIPPLESGGGAGGALPPSGDESTGDGDEERPMTLLEHLGELRSRLVRSFLAILVAFFVCYAFAKDLFYYLSLPLLKVMPADAKFIYTGVAEGFFVDLKVSLVAAVFVACPFLFYQIWAFIAPGLYEEEKRYVAPLSFCSAFFFLGGAIFCYFVVFPFAFKFFMSYSTDNIVAMLSINEYLGFALKMLIAFGLIFEMPLFSFFLSRMGIVTADRMRSVRKYAVLAVFIIAAILTPPDVFSQIMMAIPMLVLYEISILVAVVFGRRKKPAKAEEEEAGEGASA